MKAGDSIILRLAKRIKPLARFGFLKSLYYVLPDDIYDFGYEKYGKRICKAKGLVKLATLTTKFRKVGYEGAFEPTVEEALWQIPQKYLEDAVAFETKPVSSFDDEAMYQLGKTTIYGLKEGTRLPIEVYKADLQYKGSTFKAKDL